MRFRGRAAIVTGGGSGIGRQIGHRLVVEGASVVFADRDLASAVAAADKAEGEGTAIALAVDVADGASVRQLMEAITAINSTIDILVHCAGVGVERAFLEMTEEEWCRILTIDLTGTFLICQAVARNMAERGYGRIVTLSSTAGLRGGTGRAAYGAAKGGVIALTQVMAVELAPFGITANTLTPGAIETELVAMMHTAETRLAYLSGIPAARYGTPDEVASAALFLASEEARYITGHALAVDGGFLAAGVIKSDARAAR